MATISRTKVSLRIMGNELLPDEVSDILGCNPSYSQKKGQLISVKNGQREREAKFGMWRIEVPEENPGDLNAQISTILNMLSSDLSHWTELSENYDIDFFCDLFMNEEMEGIDVIPTNLLAMGERNIELGLDIYAPDSEDDSSA